MRRFLQYVSTLAILMALLPVGAEAAGPPLWPQQCSNPAWTDPTGPMSLKLEEGQPPDTASNFLMNAANCPTACYDLSASATITMAGFWIQVTSVNRCSSPDKPPTDASQNPKRGCGAGMQQPQIQITTSDSLPAMGSLKPFVMPAATIVKSRCDTNSLLTPFAKNFLGGMGVAKQGDESKGEAQMRQALTDLKNGVASQPLATAIAPSSGGASGISQALAGAGPALSSPGSPTYAGNNYTGSPGQTDGGGALPGDGGTQSSGQASGEGGATSAENPIKQTIAPNFSPSSGGLGQDNFDPQAHPQAGTPIVSTPSDLQPAPGQATSPASGATTGQLQAGQGPQTNTNSARSAPAQPTAPTETTESNSTGGGLFGGSNLLSILGSLLQPLLKLFSGSSSNIAPPPPPTVTISASPDPVSRGQQFSVSWSSNGTSLTQICQVTDQSGILIGQSDGGSQLVTTNSSTPSTLTYTATCYGVNGQSVQGSASVNVQ